MDLASLVSRCGELVGSDGVVIATGGTLISLAVVENIFLRWDPSMRRFQRQVGGFYPETIDNELASELVSTRGIQSVQVSFDTILDMDAMYRMLDTDMCDWVQCCYAGMSFVLLRADKPDIRRNIINRANAWRPMTPVSTIIVYTNPALIERIVGG